MVCVCFACKAEITNIVLTSFLTDASCEIAQGAGFVPARRPFRGLVVAAVCVLGDVSLAVLCPHLCHCRSQSEMSYILVQSPMDLSENVCCDFPFSWRIKDYLEELWAQAQYITEAGGELRRDVFQPVRARCPVLGRSFPF